jgi:hypothetical protein
MKWLRAQRFANSSRENSDDEFAVLIWISATHFSELLQLTTRNYDLEVAFAE